MRSRGMRAQVFVVAQYNPCGSEQPPPAQTPASVIAAGWQVPATQEKP